METIKFLRSESVYVSSGQRYWLKDETKALNEHWFGDRASPVGVGYNLGLSTQWMSSEEGATIQKSDFASLAHGLDHVFINDDLSYFKGRVPSPENLATYWFELVKENLPELQSLRSVRVSEGPKVWAEFDGIQHRYTEVFRINCVHRHHNPELSDGENLELYGKCSGVHGHEYCLEVTVRGEPHPKFGVIMPRAKFRDSVQKSIIAPFDKSFLNEKIGNTSGEIIADRFAGILENAFEPGQFDSLVVRETRKNSFFVPAAH